MDPDYYLQIFSAISFNTPNAGAIVALLTACLLLVASGFISASEIAFFSLTPQDKEEIEEENDKRDSVIKQLLSQSEYLLATILIGNNLVNVGVVILSSYFLSSVLVLSPVATFVVQSVILTFLLLLFGEIMPKIYASHNLLPMARLSASTLLGLQKCFYPLANVLVNSTRFVNKYVTPRNNNISMDEISQALEMTDVNEQGEKELLQGIIEFGDKTVADVMTSRVDMADINIQLNYEEVMEVILRTKYSRIPVYEGTEDSIKGVIYVKDLLPHLNQDTDFEWQSLMRTPYYVPETKSLDKLLKEFQSEKIHMAIVVDEFGGTSGLITMEDILEEIVGEISDEYDDEEQQYIKIDDCNYIFEGKTLLNDLFRITGIDEDEFEKVTEEAETLAGLILEIKEEFPQLKERITYKNYQFIVLEASKRRIIKVKLTIIPEGE